MLLDTEGLWGDGEQLVGELKPSFRVRSLDEIPKLLAANFTITTTENLAPAGAEEAL